MHETIRDTFGVSASCVPVDGSAPYTATIVYHIAPRTDGLDPAGMTQYQHLGPSADVALADCVPAPAQGDVWTIPADASKGLADDTDFRVVGVVPKGAGQLRLLLTEVAA